MVGTNDFFHEMPSGAWFNIEGDKISIGKYHDAAEMPLTEFFEMVGLIGQQILRDRMGEL